MANHIFKWRRPSRVDIKDAAFRSMAKRIPASALLPDVSLETLTFEVERLDLSLPHRVTMSDSEREVLSQVGVPVPAKVTTPRDYAIFLLQVVAEVEHALMAQYLYVAASIDPALDKSPESYIAKVMRVAIQEMGHLATIQNLLLLTGGPAAIHLQRDVLRTKSDLNAIPFVLEPLGPAAVAKFVVAEMPADIPATKVDQVSRLLALAKADSGTVPHRVGAIYAVLRWLFLPPDEANIWLDLTTLVDLPADFHVADGELTPAAEMDSLEARVDEWEASAFGIILSTPRSCAEAVAAIDLVSSQGEGWNPQGDTHFAEFLELADAVDAGLPPNLVRPIAKSPTLDPGTGGELHVLIEDSYTAAWGKVFSIQYSLVILSIYHALVTPRSTDGTSGLREGLVELAIRGMRRILDPVSTVLVALPLRTGETDLAGPPYDLDPSFVEATDADGLRARHLDALDVLDALYQSIENDKEFPVHPPHNGVVATLRSFDRRRRNLFPN